MVIFKEDGPPDDQNQGDGGARIVANDHPYMIRPPMCSFVPLQMIICKGAGSQDHQNQGDGGDGVVANDHPEDLPFLCKWSFAKRTVLQMAKIKGMEEHGLLQMTILMIRPPPCSSAPLQMVICKEDGPPDDQHFSANRPTDQELERGD